MNLERHSHLTGALAIPRDAIPVRLLRIPQRSSRSAAMADVNRAFRIAQAGKQDAAAQRQAFLAAALEAAAQRRASRLWLRTVLAMLAGGAITLLAAGAAASAL